MLKYVRGYFKKIIPMQNSLVIELNRCTHNCNECKNKDRKEEYGQPLTKETLKMALESFKRYIESVCFVGGEENFTELKELCKFIHKEKLDAALFTPFQSPSQINKNLIDELDYIIIGRCDKQGTVYKKDYCPFTETCDWIEMKEWNTLVKKM